MADLKKVIESMSDAVRSKAEAFAKANGISLEEAVSRQLNQEISDDDLDSVSGGLADREIKIETVDGEVEIEEHQ